MLRKWLLANVLAGAVLLGGAGALVPLRGGEPRPLKGDGEKDVRKAEGAAAKDVPPEVIAAIRRLVPQFEITEVRRRQKPGRQDAEYRLKLKAGNKELHAEIRFEGDGKVEGSVTEPLTAEEVPKAMADAARNALPKPKIHKARKVISLGGETTYCWSFGTGWRIRGNADGTDVRVSEEDAAANDLPAAVRATALQVASGIPITESEKRLEKGKALYRVKGADRGREIAMDIAEDGTLLNLDGEVALDSAPAPVRDAIAQRVWSLQVRRACPGMPAIVIERVVKRIGEAKVRELELEFGEGQRVYKTEVKTPAGDTHLEVAEDGALLKEKPPGGDRPRGIQEGAPPGPERPTHF